MNNSGMKRRWNPLATRRNDAGEDTRGRDTERREMRAMKRREIRILIASASAMWHARKEREKKNQYGGSNPSTTSTDRAPSLLLRRSQMRAGARDRIAVLQASFNETLTRGRLPEKKFAPPPLPVERFSSSNYLHSDVILNRHHRPDPPRSGQR